MIRVEDEEYGVNLLLKIPTSSWYISIWGDYEFYYFKLDSKRKIAEMSYSLDFSHDPVLSELWDKKML